jgi:hypothetical protein
MKLAALYTVYNGLELLEKSIEQIYPHVYEVVVCFQQTSNKGERCKKVMPYVLDLASNRIKIHLVEFTPNLELSTKENERRKHQLMVDYAKAIGCSHFFLSATDHFYHPEQVVYAKHQVEMRALDASFTKMYTYYKHPTWQLTPMEEYYMPFICKLYPFTRIERVPKFPVKVDPSVQMNTCAKWHLFDESEVVLHHYSMIREDINNKFNNAAASIRWKPEDVERYSKEYEGYDIQINPGISYFQGRRVQVVPNYFDL